MSELLRDFGAVADFRYSVPTWVLKAGMNLVFKMQDTLAARAALSSKYQSKPSPLQESAKLHVPAAGMRPPSRPTRCGAPPHLPSLLALELLQEPSAAVLRCRGRVTIRPDEVLAAQRSTAELGLD